MTDLSFTMALAQSGGREVKHRDSWYTVPREERADGERLSATTLLLTWDNGKQIRHVQRDNASI
jgi:hypothetical protein